MFPYRSVSLIVISLCLVLAGCATPGETRADYRLQGSVQNIINANEMAHGHIFNWGVVDTKVLSEDAGIVTEAWHVRRWVRTVTYTVKFTPDPKGGTNIHVDFPEEDRK